jgi:hypothetical protein
MENCGPCALGSPIIEAQEATQTAASKASYLFNFIKFVEWPALAARDTITVCFLGDSGVYDEVSKAEPRAGSRLLVARQLSPHEPLAACQVLYVDADRVPAIAATLATRPAGLLTVSDEPGFLKRGGIVELFTEGQRLRFRISVRNARRANLRVSSSLLQLASTVERES